MGGLIIAAYLISLVIYVTIEILDWRDRKSTFLRTLYVTLTEDKRETLKGIVLSIVIALPVGTLLLPRFLAWIGHNATTINAISTSIAAIGTMIYVLFTFYLVQTTIRTYRKQTQPQVAVYLEASEQGGRNLDMVIHNQGNGPAYDVSFKVDTDYAVNDFGPFKFYLKDASALKGLRYLAPHQQIRFYLGDLDTIQEGNRVDPINVEVEYYNGPKDSTREQTVDAFPIDMWRFQAPLAHLSSQQQIANSIERIADGLEQVTTSDRLLGPQDGLKVVVHLDHELQQEAQRALSYSGQGLPDTDHTRSGHDSALQGSTSARTMRTIMRLLRWFRE